jgi:DNA repair protein RecN (Recombination protein N)
MLTTLRIKNLALVDDLTLELPPGYTVITGETGAGKSILIGALDLVLGERADRSLVREGAEGCLVEAVFDIGGLRAPIRDWLEQNGLEPCQDGQLLLKRTFGGAGASRQFVNGSPATLQTLAALGQWLVDIHGPHDHQSLLQPARQLAILDAYGGLEDKLKSFGNRVRERAARAAEKTALIVDEKTHAQQMELLRFQSGEIQGANLRPGEEEELEAEYQRASNANRLQELALTALDLLSEKEESLLTQAGAVGRVLQELRRIDPGAVPVQELHEQAIDRLRELQASLSRYTDRIELDPARLPQLEERLNLIQSLKRKYGANLPEVIRFGEEAGRRLRLLEQREGERARLDAELERLEALLRGAGKELSADRRRVIPRLARAVEKQLADLGFKQNRFSIAMSSLAPDAPLDASCPSSGLDTIEFQFAPNAGEPARALRAIASSGELARVMLALKTVLAAEDEIPVLIFDEVDANVGGETANAVGDKLRQVAARRQVLCITHLPQVAAPAAAHFCVTKRIVAGRTLSEVRRLEEPERVVELARMLGGQSEPARKLAESLLKSPVASAAASAAPGRRGNGGPRSGRGAELAR